MEDNFSTDQGVGMVWGWFRCMTFIGHFISIIITSAPIRSSGIRYQRLGTSALLQFIFFTLVHHQRIKLMSCDFCLQNAPHVAELQSLGKRRDTHTQTFIHLSSGFEWQPSHIPTHVNCCDYSNNWLGSSGRRSMGGPHLPCQPTGCGGDRVGSEIEREGSRGCVPTSAGVYWGKSECYCTFHGVSVNLWELGILPVACYLPYILIVCVSTMEIFHLLPSRRVAWKSFSEILEMLVTQVCGEELKPHLTFGSNHVFKAWLPLACLTGVF